MKKQDLVIQIHLMMNDRGMSIEQIQEERLSQRPTLHIKERLAAETKVKAINDMFPPAHGNYAAFVRSGHYGPMVCVSGECLVKERLQGEDFEITLHEYYEGMFINKKIEQFAQDCNCYWEWENPAVICLTK
ncbi:MAG: hypothetical protein DRP56_04915 [Planctomycetota bacterium]|nr:MAG: hypothetical protein DRP56_04915 [Planctomycetota bacterium]